MKNFRSRLLIAAAFAVFGIFAFTVNYIVQAATVVDDTFADGISTNQSLPSSMQLLKARSGTVRTDSVGAVEMNMTATGTSSEAFWAYFTNSGSPISLGVGDSLTYSGTFSLTLPAGTGGDIRFGLFNSNGSRQTTDLTGGQNSAAFGDDTGYACQFYGSGSGSPFVLYRRDVVTPTAITNIFNSFTAAGFTNLGGTGATARQALVAATPYTFAYTVSRTTATTTQITVNVTGGSLSGLNFTTTETSATPYTNFDWFTMRIGGTNFAQRMTFTRFLIDYTPAAPTITTNPSPSSQTLAAAANTTYSVAASGAQLTYQWQKDNVNINGVSNPSALTANLSLTNLQTTDSAAYRCVVTNSGGSATSNPATLIVTSGPTDPIPVINTHPQNTSAVLGSPASLSVSVTGVNLMYQWYKNNSILGGEIGSTLNFASVTGSDTADYYVTVSNSGGTVTSNTARLTVVSAMTATTFLPATNSTAICTDSPLAITFDQVPKLGTTGLLRVYQSNGTLVDTIDISASPQTKTIGGTSFRYLPIIISGNTANVSLHQQLALNQTYYVTMDSGVLTDLSNVPFVGISNVNTFRFTTKTANPTVGSSVLTVNANGTGDFCTIQGAVDFVPASNATRVVINVKNGTYTEIVNIPGTKPLITVKGESRAGTIQRYANNNSMNPSTTLRPSFNVNTGATDFNLENITLQNSTPQGGSQAEAFRSYALRTTVNSVNLLSYQDTILTQGTAVILNSYIEGDVDFMWGIGSTFYKNTELKALSRSNQGYYSQIRNGSTSYGNVYVNCRLTKAPTVTNVSLLNRIDPDVFPYSQMVLIDSQMDTHITPVGWQFDTPDLPVTTANYPNIRYWESNIKQLDNVTPVDCSQRHIISRNDCNNPLTAGEIAFYSNPLNIAGFTPEERLTALVSLSNLTQVYDGMPKSPTITTDASGLSTNVTYNGSSTVPTNAGTYTVVATVTNPSYVGSISGTFTISPAPVTIAFSNTLQNYDGTPKVVTATTTPSGVALNVTYAGSSVAPTAIGNYALSATSADTNYTGSATGTFTIASTTKPFAEADGAGAYTIGGRGGDTYHVTNLNDSGAGSLREGILSATAPRTIVFDVSGQINLLTNLNINKPFMTIAGQTAPGDGITIAGRTSVVNGTQHVILRYLRFRGSDVNCPSMQGDSLWVDNSKDVLIDHVTASWSIDETLSVTDSTRVSIQWSYITESLKASCHSNGSGGTESHGYGALIRYGDGIITYHHNLFAHHFNRNPRVGDNITLEFVNNIIYDWGTDASYSGPANEGTTKINYIGNYLVAGPTTPVAKRNRAFNGGSISTLIYQTGNVIDGNLNGIHDGTDTDWAMFVGLYTQSNVLLRLEKEKQIDVAQLAVTPESAGSAYTRILASGGDSKFRDAVDTRIANQLMNETGTQIDSQTQVGGFPMLNSMPAPIDTDGDGMPDSWENSHGLNANDPNDATTVLPSGLTNLETYLNSLVNLAPTAANVHIGGRILTSNGRGISRARITLTSNDGVVRYATTNSFGYYNFNDLAAGETYIISVASKRYTFVNPTQVVTINEDLTDFNFVANN